MTTIEDLRRAMERAAAAMDFEEAGRLRDRISLLRHARGDVAIDEIDPSGLTRQRPGAMGLGTSRQNTTPADGWVPPKKPDPLTANRSRKPAKPR